MALKKTSEVITISSSISESAANTFTQSQVDLQLNPLDQEVFVVLAVDLNPAEPEMIINTNTEVRGSLSTTSRTTIGNISDSNVLAEAVLAIRSDAVQAVGFSRMPTEAPLAQLDYIGIIATNDFFLQVLGVNNSAAKSMNARLWGYRAKADAATYAALTQSEILSS
tara:strand:- start:618 stop:1118 length:501 start_codon:yes stop_codon:yes gene_type:complete